MATEGKKMVLQSMSTLLTTALGLVGALAWNDAIKEIIKRFFGGEESLTSKITYAVLATILALVIVFLMGKAIAKANRNTISEKAVD